MTNYEKRLKRMREKPKIDYQNWDGVKYEEDKMTAHKHSSPKSRGCFSLSQRAKDNHAAIDWSKKVA